MSFIEILGSIVAGSGTFASILGVLLAKASRENGKATRELIRAMDDRAEQRHREVMETAEQRHREVVEQFGRMDDRAEQRHGEIVELLKRGFGDLSRDVREIKEAVKR